MSSPPNTPTSSPHKLHVSIPKKRPGSFTTGVAISNKRRNLSTSTTYSHPLRQTSFPPSEQNNLSQLPLSPAAEEFAACHGSVTSSSVGAETKHGNKRKKGHQLLNTATSENPTSRGPDSHMDGKGSVGGTAGDGKEDEEFEDEDGDGNLETVLDDGAQLDLAAIKQEKEHLALLMSAFNNEQADRYDVWRRVRLKKETVRKITNQTLSQSVPASIVTTINGYTKLFIGDIIERARNVQSEWLVASTQLTPNGDAVETKQPFHNEIIDSRARDIETRSFYYSRAPLVPAHLREALRRYKKDKEGGGVGFHGISLDGATRIANVRGGKRIFK